MGRHKNKILICTLTVVILVFVYWWGGNAPTLRGWDTEQTQEVSQFQFSEGKKIDFAQEEGEQNEKPVKKDNTTPSGEKSPQKEQSKKDNSYATAHSNANEGGDKTTSSNKPKPIEPSDVNVTDKALTCTLSVRCDTILKNIDWIGNEKKSLVPSNGVIFEEKEVIFYEGESVFNILTREMKKNKIHLEFMKTPIYNSAYIEGIANLYELDCGELSGWVYRVNGWFPNYGCSRYQLKSGDRVEWLYTCDLGLDVGGYKIDQKDE